MILQRTSGGTAKAVRWHLVLLGSPWLGMRWGQELSGTFDFEVK